jgi:dGTPase
MADYGGWDHNAHTIRTLTLLESPYPHFSGLNLSWELLEGLAKHNGPVHQAPWALADYNAQHDLELTTHASLEAQVAALADDIAYDNHDIDDGLRSGLLAFDALLDVPFIASSWAGIQKRLTGVPHAAQVRELIRDMIGQMVNDLIVTSSRAIAAAGVTSAAEVRAHGDTLVTFSPNVADAERQIKTMLYAQLYRAPPVRALQIQARDVVGALFETYRADPSKLPDDWHARLPAHEPARARHISDFIAGMTDRYALARYTELIGPHAMSGGF